MHTLELFEPSGATEITRLHAPRLRSLEGRTIAIHSNEIWQAHRTLPLLRTLLEDRFENITILTEEEFPEIRMISGRTDAEDRTDALVRRGVDAVIVGNAG